MSLNQEKNLSLDELIQTYSSLKYNEQKTKVRFFAFFSCKYLKSTIWTVLPKVICEWSGHEMPTRAEAVLVYVNGNKYKALSRTKINNDELKKYSEFLITKPKQRNKFVLF
jgi:hypothetical protein